MAKRPYFLQIFQGKQCEFISHSRGENIIGARQNNSEVEQNRDQLQENVIKGRLVSVRTHILHSQHDVQTQKNISETRQQAHQEKIKESLHVVREIGTVRC